jgi:Tfp pilus assembly protein PilV
LVDTGRMLHVASAIVSGGLHRLRSSQAGMSIVETMVAAVILSAGVLGVFVMVETADRVNAESRGRNTATAIARELLEEARSTQFQSIGAHNWFNGTLQNISGGDGRVLSPTAQSARTTVTRDKVTYQVDVTTCTVDDAKDGYGTHSTSSWCSDSTATGAADAQPEDMKRVAISMAWTGQNGKAEKLYQTATIGSRISCVICSASSGGHAGTGL